MWCGDPCVDKQFLLDPHPILTVGITLSLGFIVHCLKYKLKKMFGGNNMSSPSDKEGTKRLVTLARKGQLF